MSNQPLGVKELMETSTEQIGNVLKIKVIGRLVAGCAEEFKQMLMSSANTNNQILLDLSQMNYDFSAISYVKNVNGHLFVTYSDGISQLSKLAIINSNDAIIYNSNIGTNIVSVTQTKGYYAISVDRRVFIYNTNGVITNDYSVDEDIIRMNFISGNKLCVVSTSGVHTIN